MEIYKFIGLILLLGFIIFIHIVKRNTVSLKIFVIMYILLVFLAYRMNRNEELDSIIIENDKYVLYFNWFRSTGYFLSNRERGCEENYYILKKNNKKYFCFKDKIVYEGGFTYFSIDTLKKDSIILRNYDTQIITPCNKKRIKQNNITIFFNESLLTDSIKTKEIVEVW